MRTLLRAKRRRVFPPSEDAFSRQVETRLPAIGLCGFAPLLSSGERAQRDPTRPREAVGRARDHRQRDAAGAARAHSH
eukprot:3229719-Pleurochrysis_carterae.AAC.1